MKCWLVNRADLPMRFKGGIGLNMRQIRLTLSEAETAFVEKQVVSRGHRNCADYVESLIRKDQEFQTLRNLLTAGQSSIQGAEAHPHYFEGLRSRIARDAHEGGCA